MISVAENPWAPILSPFRLSGWILWLEDDAGDAGDRLEGELGPSTTSPSCSAWLITLTRQFSAKFTGLSGSYGLKTTPATPVTVLWESSVTSELTSGLSVADNLSTPIVSSVNQSERILRPEDDAGDAGDRLEGELGHQQLDQSDEHDR